MARLSVHTHNQRAHLQRALRRILGENPHVIVNHVDRHSLYTSQQRCKRLAHRCVIGASVPGLQLVNTGCENRKRARVVRSFDRSDQHRVPVSALLIAQPSN